MIAEIASGELDLADLLLLVAVIVFAVVAVILGLARDVTGTLTSAGLGLVALALLVL